MDTMADVQHRTHNSQSKNLMSTGANSKGAKAKINITNRRVGGNVRLQIRKKSTGGASSGGSSNQDDHSALIDDTNEAPSPLKKSGATDLKNFVDLKTREERAKLLQAIRSGDEDLVKQLVRKDGYNSNFGDEEDPLQPTPLMIALQEGHPKIVKYLLRGKPYRANVNAENRIGQRSIWLAAKKGDAEMAELLINDGRDKCEVNYIDKQSGMSPLYRAIMSKAAAVCRILIHAGADVNIRRLGVTGDAAEAETPLIKAVQLGSLGVCEVLVNSLVDLQAKTASGFTALHYAVAYRRYKITRYLLSERIKINAKAKHGITAMALAVIEDIPAMVDILMEYGYSIDRRYQWGETPLEMALRIHSEECALLMLNWGCSWKQKDSRKKSYFHLACHEGLCTVAKYLIEVHPHFLQESWLKENQQPMALYKKQTFYDWLLEVSAHPFSLKDLCRAKILRVVGKYPVTKVEKLPLPESVQETLKLKHYFTGDKIERKYRQKSLFAKECPFDCPPLCIKPQCPDIEFSDSASEFEDFTESEEESEEEGF